MLPLILLAPAAEPAFTLPATSQQVLISVTSSWTATTGILMAYQRDSSGAWTSPDGLSTTMVVGKSGLGWGTGLHPAGLEGPVKREGDGRAPAGVFHLGTAMGYAPTASFAWPYQPSGDDTRCVDDTASSSYNQVVGAETPVSWTSAETMRRTDGLYELLVLVGHNEARVAGDGSCIFLHVWRAASKATVGCTAMSKDALERIVAWLDPAAEPLLVQLPKDAYGTRISAWGLP